MSCIELGGDDDDGSERQAVFSAVAAPPALADVSPSFLIQKEGATVDLFCDAIASPAPTLTWFKDGEPLRRSERVTIEDNRSVQRARIQSRGVIHLRKLKSTELKR